MTTNWQFAHRLILLSAAALVTSLVFTACRPSPKASVPNINDIVATGMAGTQHARALGTIVSATQAAISGQAQTPAPPSPATAAVAGAANADANAAVAAQPDDPCTGSVPGKRAYKSVSDGYCLFYPEDFFVNRPLDGSVEFLGPALDKSSQPLRAYIAITKSERVGGRTLDEIASSTWKNSRGAYRLSNIQLGGQDALVAENLQIGEAGWKVKQVLFTHAGNIYLISLSPVDSTPPFDTALPDIQRFWDLAIPSFKFQ